MQRDTKAESFTTTTKPTPDGALGHQTRSPANDRASDGISKASHPANKYQRKSILCALTTKQFRNGLHS